jgi:hypothetical protein
MLEKKNIEKNYDPAFNIVSKKKLTENIKKKIILGY